MSTTGDERVSIGVLSEGDQCAHAEAVEWLRSEGVPL